VLQGVIVVLVCFLQGVLPSLLGSYPSIVCLLGNVSALPVLVGVSPHSLLLSKVLGMFVLLTLQELTLHYTSGPPEIARI